MRRLAFAKAFRPFIAVFIYLSPHPFAFYVYIRCFFVIFFCSFHVKLLRLMFVLWQKYSNKWSNLDIDITEQRPFKKWGRIFRRPTGGDDLLQKIYLHNGPGVLYTSHTYIIHIIMWMSSNLWLIRNYSGETMESIKVVTAQAPRWHREYVVCHTYHSFCQPKSNRKILIGENINADMKQGFIRLRSRFILYRYL